MVVVGDERVDLGLECADCRGAGLSAEPFLHRLLEALDLAACRWMVGSAVLLTHPKSDEFGF